VSGGVSMDSNHIPGGGATLPLPRDGCKEELRGDHKQSSHTPSLDQRSKMEAVVLKMARRRGSDVRQSQRR